ncbi:MAG: dockerin type I repeat-containing protein [candidate division Zixibacteria bacterium]|nr:dockerin type I repeat-containing protein [candidate division Zixibacteria bacterium]
MRRLIFIFCLLIATNVCFGADSFLTDVPAIEWENRYGFDSTNDYGYSVIQTLDSNFVMVGFTKDKTTNISKILVTKLNRNGDCIWTRRYDLENDYGYAGYDITNTLDGNYIICGEKHGNSTRNAFLMGLDSTGDSLWVTESNSFGEIGATGITQCINGGYYFTGWGIIGAQNKNTSFLAKIDTTGNLEWLNYYQSEHYYSAIPQDIIVTQDENIVTIGSIDTIGTGIQNTHIIKWDSSGNQIWQKQYGSNEWVGSQKGISVFETQNNEFITCGYEYVEGGIKNIRISRIDNAGDVIWERLYGDTLDLLGTSIMENTNNDLLFTGESAESSYIFCADASGNVKWMDTHGAVDEEIKIEEIIESYDGGYLLVGRQGDWSAKSLDMLTIKYTTTIPNVITFSIDALINNSHVISDEPIFSWSVYYPDETTAEYIQIDVGINTDWSMPEMWSTGEMSYVDNSIAYAGLPLADGDTYFIRLKVKSNELWSPWYETSFRMNTPPTIPTTLSPVDSAIAASTQPYLWVYNALDAEGDDLFYDFHCYVDCVVYGGTNIVQMPDSTYWQVEPSLWENGSYSWLARAYDGYEYSDWTLGEIFFVNETEEWPYSFEVTYPPDTGWSQVYDFPTEFRWIEPYEPDPLDSVYYKLLLSLDENFTFVATYDSLWDNNHSIMLDYGTHYWWKVKAIDTKGNITESDNVADFLTWVLGDANGDAQCNVGDAVYIINYAFKGGLAPYPLKTGDANGDCSVNIGDAVYIINFAFKGGPSPLVGCAGEPQG